MTKPNNIFSLKIVKVVVFLSLSYLSGFGQGKEDYYHYLDSANVAIDVDTKKTISFLERIPLPLEEHIKGRVAEYYAVKALIHDEYNEYSKFHKCNILALKYAVIEKNYCIAGQASLDLYTDKYLISEDTSSTKYLDIARKYLEKCDKDKYAVLQIETMQAYYKSLDGKYKESNTIILDNLEYYNSIKDEEGYYYMFANYLLASNYLQLYNLNKAHYYYNALEKCKANKTITSYNHKSFLASVDMFFAELYFERKQTDSTFAYLKKAALNSNYMTGDVIKDYYQLSAKVYKQHNNIEKTKAYIDSLLAYEDKLYMANIDASFDINNELLAAETALIEEKKQNASIIKLMLWILCILVLISLAYFFFYKKQSAKIKTVETTTNDLSYLKSNNEQLTIKLYGLEAYLKNLKNEIKTIASLNSLEEQKIKIKELYKNLHISSSTILDKNDSHLALINDLNIDFFKKIEKLYPNLSKSEIIICYYILIGFTNKEISVFLNSTIRSVESKRYRISKKMNFDRKQITLVEHLQSTFHDTIHKPILSDY